MTGRRPLVLAVVVLLLPLVGCDGGGGGGGGGGDADGPATAYDPARDTSVYDDAPSTETFDDAFREDYETQVSLPDGRKVRLWYSASGDRLLEQHYSPREGAWTTPVVLHRSEEPDPCQGIEVTEEDGVVAVIADFGLYCYDGDPPSDSLALAATGDLTTWDVDSALGFDGWQAMTIEPAADGPLVTWDGPDGTSLTWTAASGFAGGA